MVKNSYPEEKEFSNYFKIKNLDNLYEYTEYFKLKEDKEKNIYEKLFKYKFEKKEKEFEELYNVLGQRVKEKNITEEIFIFQVLKEDFEGAKNTSFLKPELFFDLINYMVLTNVDKKLIKKFVEDFEVNFSEKYKREILSFKIKNLLNDSEKTNLIEEYLKSDFDAEFFELYFRLSKNIDFLKTMFTI